MTDNLAAFDLIKPNEYYLCELGRNVAMLEENVPDDSDLLELGDYIKRLETIKLRVERLKNEQ